MSIQTMSLLQRRKLWKLLACSDHKDGCMTSYYIILITCIHSTTLLIHLWASLDTIEI